MSSVSPSAPLSPTDQQLENLLACPPPALTDWIAAHHPQLDLAFLQALKDCYATTHFILADPKLADRATCYGLAMAEQMSDEPLALPLAQWARGLYEMFYAPEIAITLFQQAQLAYHIADDNLSVARLAANLVGVLAECGRFAEAEAAYDEAHPIFLNHADTQPLYLVRLEQNYGWLLHNQGRYSEALQVHERAIEHAHRHRLNTSLAELRVNRHLTLGMLGRLAEVVANLQHERTDAESHQQLLTVARIDMNIGDLFSVQGRPAAALHQLQQAQQAFAELGNDMEIGSIALRQASLLRRIGARRAAIRCYAQAQEIFTRANMLPQVGEILVNMALTRRQEGDYAQAFTLLAQAEQLWQSLHHPHWLAIILSERIALTLELGEVASAQQLLAMSSPLADNARLQAEFTLLQAETLRLDKHTAPEIGRAEANYQAAYTYAATQGNRWLQRQALSGWGKLLLSHDPTRARALFEQAISLDETIRQTLTVEELKAGFHAQAMELFVDLIRLAVGEAQPWQALHWSWRAKAGALLDLLAAVSAAATVTPTSYVEIEQVRQQLATLRWQLAAESGSPQTWQEQTQPAITRLEQQLLDLRRQRNAATAMPDEVFLITNPAAVLAQMDADILLEFVGCGDELLGIYADRRGHCVSVWLGDVETIADLNARLQLSFEHVVHRSTQDRATYTPAWLAECRPLLAQGYQQLIAPLLHHAPSPTAGQTILLAPCAPLFLLPFAAFWDGQQYWGETNALELIPSGALLTLPPPTSPTYSPPLIVAAATGQMTAVRDEAYAVAQALPTSITFLDTPVLQHLNTLQDPPRFLHLAAHTLLREDAPIFSGLQLAGEVLTVEACYELPLRGTTLVTLSGCTTAGGQENESALLAFQAALFVAGAQRVLSSLWPVADDAAAIWMAHFYDFLAQGMSVAQAVQATQRHLLADPRYSHPAIWAAFACARR